MAYKAPGTYARFVKTASSVVSAGGSRIMALVGTGINYYTVTNEAITKSNTKPYDTLANENVFEITSVSSRPVYDGVTINNTIYSPTTGNGDGYTLNGNTIVWDSLVDASCSLDAKKCPKFYYNNGTQNIEFSVDETVEKLVEDGKWMIEVSYVNEDDQDLGADEKLGCYRIINMNTSEIIGEYVVGSSPATNEDGSYPIPGIKLTIYNTYISDFTTGKQLVNVGDYVTFTTVAAKTEKEAQVAKVLATTSGPEKVNINLDLIVNDNSDSKTFKFGNIIGADNYKLYISNSKFETDTTGAYDTSKAFIYPITNYSSDTNQYSETISNDKLKKYAVSYDIDTTQQFSLLYSVENKKITLRTTSLDDDLSGYSVYVPYTTYGTTEATITTGIASNKEIYVCKKSDDSYSKMGLYVTNITCDIVPLMLNDNQYYLVEQIDTQNPSNYDFAYTDNEKSTITYYNFVKSKNADTEDNTYYNFTVINEIETNDGEGTITTNYSEDENGLNLYVIGGAYSRNPISKLTKDNNEYYLTGTFATASNATTKYYKTVVDFTEITNKYIVVDFKGMVLAKDNTATVQDHKLTTTYINNSFVLVTTSSGYVANKTIDEDQTTSVYLTFKFDEDSFFATGIDDVLKDFHIENVTALSFNDKYTYTLNAPMNKTDITAYYSKDGKTINNLHRYINEDNGNNNIYIKINATITKDGGNEVNEDILAQIVFGDNVVLAPYSKTETEHNDGKSVTKAKKITDLLPATPTYNYLLVAYDVNGNIVDTDLDAEAGTADVLPDTNIYNNTKFYNAIGDLTVVSNSTIYSAPAVYELTYTRKENDGEITITRYVEGKEDTKTFETVGSLEDDYFEVIPGIEFSLDGKTLDAQITDLNDTATVYITTSPRVTSDTMPAEGATYYVSYKYRKADADYEPKLYTNYDDIVAAYGNYDVSASGAVLNSLSLGAEIAYNNGVSQIVCVQAKNGADYEIETAIDKLSKTIAGASNVQTIIPLSTSDAVGAYLQNHINLMSSYEYGKERMGYLAARPNQLINKIASRSDRTVGMAETAEGYADERIVYVVPGAIKKSIRDLRTGKYNTRTLDGCYAAVAVAAIGLSNDPAEPLTNKTISGFTELVDLYTESEKNILAAAGCCVLEPNGTNIRIRHGITTATDEVNSQEITLIQIKDYVIESCRTTTANLYIGKKLTSSIISDIKYTMNSILTQFVGQAVIINYSSLKVVRNSDEPRQIDISFEIEAVYPLNWISIEFGFSSTSF
jgi:hypothetical protein